MTAIAPRRRAIPSALQKKIRQLYEKGVPKRQIARDLGVAAPTVRKYLKAPACNEEDILNKDSWLGWLESMTTNHDRVSGGGRNKRINGEPLEKTAPARAFYAWTNENRPVHFKEADKFCCHIDCNVQEFFNFCDHEGLEPWDGEPPAWEI